MEHKTLLRDYLMNYHRGKSLMAGSPELEEYLEIPGASVRMLISELINEGYPIGSTTRDGGGYFWITNWAEYAESVSHLISRAKMIMGRARQLRANCNSELGPQERLF